METDAELLDRYVTRREEDAFRLLVERHAGMVLGTARRRAGDAALAEEAGQMVFTLLARKAPALRRLPPDKLGGWLHRTALLSAGNLLRAEMRRRTHHARFAADALAGEGTAPEAEDAAWRAALPLVDEAIDSLPEADRQLVVRRFYQGATFRELSAGTGRTEDAVRKRTGQALERLSAFFRRRGVTLSAASLLSGLGARVAEAASAPPGYAAAVTAAASARASSLSVLTVFTNTLATMALTKITVTAAAVAFLTPLGLHWSGAVSEGPPAVSADHTGAVESGAPGHDDERQVLTARGRPAPSPGVSGLSAAFARFAQEMAKATSGSADDRRLAELQRLVFELPEAELPAAFQLLRGAGGQTVLAPVVTALTARQAETDAPAALRMAADTPEALRNAAWTGALQVWARRDFEAAFAWALARPDTPERTLQVGAVYHELMTRDPVAALARLEEVPGEAMRIPFRRWALEVWRDFDPDGAIEWIKTVEPEEARARELKEFVNGWAGSRPDLAVEHALKNITDPAQRAQVIEFSFMQWGMHDAPAATHALMNLPPDLQTTGMARMAGMFIANVDAPGLLAAARELPPGDFRDEIQASALVPLTAADPALARETVEGIASPVIRRQAARTFAREWMKKDAAAARPWIEASPDIPEEHRKGLLTPPSSPSSRFPSAPTPVSQ